MPRCRPLLALLPFALVFAGCATRAATSYPSSVEARLALYARTTPCCDDPSALAYQALPAQGELLASVDRGSQAFDFHSGVSPLAAFRLPQADAPYRLRVKSLFDAGGSAGSVFYPVVAVLDDAFIVVRMSNLDHLRLDPSLATPGGETGLSVTVPVDPAGARERYLVVFTPAALLGAAPRTRREGDLLTPSSLAWLERRGDALVPPSPYGRLQITVAPELRTP